MSPASCSSYVVFILLLYGSVGIQYFITPTNGDKTNLMRIYCRRRHSLPGVCEGVCLWGALSRSLCSRGVWCVLLPHLRADTSDDACLWNMLMECINGDTIIRIILLHCNGGWWCVPRMPNEGATIDCPGIIKSISSGARRRISGSGGCPPHPVARLEVH